MPQPFTTTGGADIGWVNASAPLARLTSSPESLSISVLILGKYTFTPNQVHSITRQKRFLFYGIYIEHCNPDCPTRVIFWPFGGSDLLLTEIQNSGFTPSAPPSSALHRTSIPVRISTVIAAIVLWNSMFFLAISQAVAAQRPPGPLLLAPLLCVLAIAFSAPRSLQLQRLILKPGRTIGEIKPFLRLITLISGFLLVVFSIILSTGAFDHLH